MHSSLYQRPQRILLLGLIFCIFVVPGINGVTLPDPVHPLSFLALNIDPGAAAAAKQVTVPCIGGCQCLKEADAASVLGSSYEKCAAVPCEYDAAGTAKFCFHKKAQQPATTITTAVIQVPVVQYAKSAVPTTTAPAIVVKPALISQVPAAVAVSCPEGCTLMSEPAAKERYGSFERCSDSPRGYDSNGSPNYCIRPHTPTPIISDRLQPALISQVPAAVAASCPADCSLMSEAAAREQYGTFERCSESPKGYDDRGSPNYCIRAAIPEGLADTAFQPSLVSGAAKAAAFGNTSSTQSTLNIGTSAVRLWNTRDALSALQVAVGKASYDSSLDLNGDGRVDSSDAREILRRSVMQPG